MQLLLPVEWNCFDEYSQHYIALMRQGVFTILDNGAAEAQQIDNDELVHLIDDLSPSEVACPDVLKDTDSTVASTFNFLHDHEDQLMQYPGKVGYVAQGTTVRECLEGVGAVIDSSVGHFIETIYIPRLLIKETHNRFVRQDVAHALYRRYGEKYQYHLFGASTLWPQELLYQAQRTPEIRSMDTSLPYVAAMQYVELTPDMEPLEAGRPDRYFECELDSEQSEIADKNVETMLRWANGQP